MLKLWETLSGLVSDSKGQTLVEYVLILVLVAVIVIIMLTGFGSEINNTYSSINSAMP